MELNPPPSFFQAISYSHRLKPIHISPNKLWFLCFPLFCKTVSKLFFSLHIFGSYKILIVDRLIRHQFIQTNSCQVQYYMYVNLWEKNPEQTKEITGKGLDICVGRSNRISTILENSDIVCRGNRYLRISLRSLQRSNGLPWSLNTLWRLKLRSLTIASTIAAIISVLIVS